MARWREEKRRSGEPVRVLNYNPWNFNAEEGDIMVGGGKAWRLCSRKGSWAAAAGELYMYPLHGFHPGKRAAIVDGKLVWREASDA